MNTQECLDILEKLKSSSTRVKEILSTQQVSQKDRMKEIVKEINVNMSEISKSLENTKKNTLLRKVSKLFSKKETPLNTTETENDEEWVVDEEGYRVCKKNTQESVKALEIKLNSPVNPLQVNTKENLDILSTAGDTLRNTLKRKDNQFLKVNREIQVYVNQGEIVNYKGKGEIILNKGNNIFRNIAINTDNLKELIKVDSSLKEKSEKEFEILKSENLQQVKLFEFGFSQKIQEINNLNSFLVWKNQDKELKMFLIYKFTENSDQIKSFKIQVFIKKENSDEQVSVQSKPEGVWNSSINALEWDFAGPGLGKVLAKFNGNGLSAGIVNLSYYVESSEPSVIVNGENLAKGEVVLYKFTCT